MGTQATSTYEITSWDESPFDEEEGAPGLARASVTKSFEGDIEGESTLEYLMMYRDDGTASFVGLERVVGRIGDRSGSFVLRHDGVYEAGTAKGTCTIVPGSGTGDLHGMKGEGDFEAEGENAPYPFTLEYSFE